MKTNNLVIQEPLVPPPALATRPRTMTPLLVDSNPHPAIPWRFEAPTPGRHKALEMAQRVAPSSCPVLILGPTGVGKEVLAEDIHRHSAQTKGPFVSVNCAAVVPSLFESEFFGRGRLLPGGSVLPLERRHPPHPAAAPKTAQ